MSTYINLLDEIGNIGNKKKCISIIQKLAINFFGDSKTDIQVAEDINRLYKEPFYYFDDFYEPVEENDFNAKFCWVDSGLIDIKGNIIYFQFSKSAFGWQGALVNNADDIIAFQENRDGISYHVQLPALKLYLKNNETHSRTSDNKIDDVDEDEVVIKQKSSLDCDKTKAFYQNLYDRLLIQTDWDLKTNNLRYYIDSIISRLNHKITKKEDVYKYIIYNKNKTKAIINSGLLDKFGNIIMIKSDIFIKQGVKLALLSFTNLDVVNSKYDLVEDNFDKDKIKNYNIDRVEFFNKSRLELVFDADIDDFDLDNWERLNHCISERRERFPDTFKDASPEVLCQDVISAVKLGVKLSKYDSSFVKPIYCINKDFISFVIPYYVGKDLQKQPELGIVVRNYEGSGLWQIMTILDYETCCMDAKVLNLYAKESFV